MQGHDPLLRRLFDAGADQDHCVSAKQLVAADFEYDTIRSLVTRGAMSRVFHGVYLLGARTLTDRQFKRAALLAAGPDAALSHATAAAMHGLIDPRPSETWVTTPQRRRERTLITEVPVAAIGEPGTVRIVGSRSARRTVSRDGMQLVGAAGALVGFAADGDPEEVLRAWKEADYRNQLRARELDDETGRGIAGSKLIGEIRSAVAIVSDDHTRIETRAEFALLAAVLEIGLPRPQVNRPLRLPGATYFPDQHYVDVGLVVEVDGGIHRRPARQAADQARDRHMRRHGLAVLRFGNEEVEEDALACARRVLETHASLSAARRTR